MLSPLYPSDVLAYDLPAMPAFTLCATYGDAFKAASELSRFDTLVLDCEGREIGMPGGALSIITIGNVAASRIYLFDAVALSDRNNPLLAPLLALLRREDIIKLVWDGRSDFLEIVDAYGVEMNGVVDLQVVEVVERQELIHRNAQGIRAKYTVDYFKKLKDELAANPSALDGIHRVMGLDQFAGVLQLLKGIGGKDRESLVSPSTAALNTNISL